MFVLHRKTLRIKLCRPYIVNTGTQYLKTFVKTSFLSVSKHTQHKQLSPQT